MAWQWFALVAERPLDAFAAARAYEVNGRPAGFLAAWRGDQGQPAGALGIDVHAVDPDGEPAWVSLALAPPGLRLLFDDPAACWALRQVLVRPPVTAMSTLTLGSARPPSA